MGGFIALLGGAAGAAGTAGATGAAGASVGATAGATAGAAGAAGAGIGSTAGAAMGSGIAAGAAAEGAGTALGSGLAAGAGAAEAAGGAGAAGAAAASEGAKGFFSQMWDTAKKDIKDTAEKNFIVRDSAGKVDKGKTGYQIAKQVILSGRGGGGDESAAVPEPEDMSHAAPADVSGVQAPNAEDELNKLRNRING